MTSWTKNSYAGQQKAISSNAMLLWPAYTSTKVINVLLLFFSLICYFTPTLLDTVLLSYTSVNKTKLKVNWTGSWNERILVFCPTTRFAIQFVFSVLCGHFCKGSIKNQLFCKILFSFGFCIFQRVGFCLHLDKERVYYGEHVLINLVSF